MKEEQKIEKQERGIIISEDALRYAQPMLITAPPVFPEKKFVCKGKHQYREINGQWICQCGRNIKD